MPAAPDCRSRLDLLARTALEAFADASWRISPPLPRADATALAAACAETPLGKRLARVARAALAERGRQHARENFDSRVMTRRLEEIYAAVLTGGGRAVNQG